MLWIDDDPMDSNPAQGHVTQTSNLFDVTEVHSSAFPNEGNTQPYAYGVKSIAETINQTEGGQQTPGNLLAWATGFLSTRQKWQRFTGMVIAPPRTAQLRASTPYGNIGRSNHSQNLLLGTEYQDTASLLPDAAAIARSYTRGNA